MNRERSKPGRMAYFITGWLGMLFYFTQRWIFGPLIPPLMQAFGADSTTMGLIGSASMWGYVFIPIAAGLFSDRFGRKYIILLGVAGFSGLTALAGLASSPTELFWIRFFTGTMEALYFVPATAFTLELFPERPAFFLGLLISGSSLGWFVGPALAGWLLDVTGTWRSAFLVVGLAGLLVAFLQLRFWPVGVKQANRSALFFDRDILRPRSMLMLLFLGLVLTCQMACEFGFSMWFPVYLKKELMMSATAAGLLTGVFGLGQAAGRPVTGILADRVGYRQTGSAASAITGIFFMLTLTAGSTMQRLVYMLVAGFVSTAATGGVWTFTGLAFTRYKGLALGIIVTMAYCTASLSPVTIGYITDHYSVATALWTVSVPCAFAAALFVLPTFLLKKSE